MLLRNRDEANSNYSLKEIQVQAMKRSINLVILSLVLNIVLVTPMAFSGPLLWGLDTGDDTLFTLDLNTGTVNAIGSLPSFYFGGLDWDSSGNLYAILSDGRFNSSLYSVNPINASTTLLGLTGHAFESFEIINDSGYSADVSDISLYSVNLSNGSATLIGSHDTGSGDNRLTGLASDGVNLYGTRLIERELVQLDTSTGGVQHVIGDHGLSSATSLAFLDGRFWTIPATSKTLYSLDPLNANPTVEFSGLTELGHVTGLTVPEPTTLLFLGLGGLALRKKRQTI